MKLSDLAAVKKSFKATAESTYGELEFTSKPDLDAYLASGDGDAWRAVFSSVDWVAQEAEGGLVGFCTHLDEEPVVVYLDNEGSFHATGRRFVDHLSFVANGNDSELLAFCKSQGIPAPMAVAERKKLGRFAKTLNAQFEAARQKKKKPTSAKGPRPFSREVAACVLGDGHAFAVTGDDFGNAYGDKITRGATFSFDPSTSTFTAHAPPPNADDLMPILALPFGNGALVIAQRSMDAQIVSLLWDRSTTAWSESTPVPVNSGSGLVAHRLENGSALAFGGKGDKSALYEKGRWIKLAKLLEPRANDQVVPWGAGRLLVGCGTTDDDESTDKALVFDIEKRTWSRGPSLPEPTRGKLVQRADGSVMLIDDERVFWKLTGKKFERVGTIPALTEVHGLFTVTGPDRLVTVRWTDRSVLEIDLVTLKARTVGHVLLGKASVALPIADQRVLLLGGTLFENLEAEPEVWDATKGTSSPIAGYDKEVAKQAAASAKENEKNKKKGYWPWARGEAITG